ncbi:MAG: hypothetical protein ACR2PO_19905 [Methyloligellaceae bacterium]
MPRNDLSLVRLALARLAETGAEGIVFGGWAKELLGICAPCAHRDIDLFVQARSFDPIDCWLSRKPQGIVEIERKRFAHKRAFTLRETMVEIILVERDAVGPITQFWGDVPFRWIEPLGVSVRPSAQDKAFSVTSPENLARYQSHHATIQPWRWKDPASLVARPDT